MVCVIDMHQNNTYSWVSFIQITLDSIGSDINVTGHTVADGPIQSIGINRPLAMHCNRVFLISLLSTSGTTTDQGGKLCTYSIFETAYILKNT